MTLSDIKQEQLDDLPRADLLALVKFLLTEVQRLQERIADLEAQLSSGQPPPTSRNSSQPPSRDQKTNARPQQLRRRGGAKRAQGAATRALVEHPDKVIEAPVECCANCQADLRGVAPQQIVRHQLTELPVVRPLVIETRTHEVECPQCHTLQRGALPEGLEPTRQFGPRLEATVVYYKQEQHLSYERLVETLRDLWGVELSEGGLNCILRRAGAAAQPLAAEIAAQVAQSAIIGSDETSARVKAQNWWQWVFRSAAGIVHRIAPTRSAAVVEQFMGEHCAECWVSDCYGAQLKAPAQRRQLCLPHQVRALQRLIEQDAQLAWPRAVQSLFQEAIHLWNRFTKEDALTINGYLRRVTEIENKLDDLLAQDLRGTVAQTLHARFVKHRDSLLTFLHYAGVPPDNNACERALRPSVIHRKVTNGFRSEWAAKAYAALETVIETGKLQGHRTFQILVELMGKPVLHFLDTSNL
jgi:transposase